MKHLKKSQYIADQSNVIVKKSQKHDVNLQKNSTLYFQVGLIVCLLAVFSLFEMQFESKDYVIVQPPPIDDIEEVDIKNIRVYQENRTLVEPMKDIQKLGAKNPIIKQNDFPELENTKIIISEPNETNKPIDPGSIIIKKVIDDVPIPWNSLEKVPIYPGCESAKTNDKRKKCMSEKIALLIQKKFNTDIGSNLGLTGVQKIDVQFKIDKTGTITDIKTRAPFSQLEDEALRVVEKIPVMKPGLQRGQPVSVLYNLPIVFKVQ